MKRNITKRLAAWFMVLCFVLMQMNLPVGCLKLDLSFLNAHAAPGEDQIVWQYDATSPYITYTINEDGTSVTATRYDVTLTQTITNPSTVLRLADDKGMITTKTGTTYPVTAIGTGCMTNVQTFISVVIPPTVTTIGNEAFSGCKQNFTSITFPENSSCTTIGDNAFNGCSFLGKEGETLELPKALQHVGNNAFAGCQSLTGVKFTSNWITLGSEAFANDTNLSAVQLPDQLPPESAGTTKTLTGTGTFSGCTALEAVNIPNQDTIPDETFKNCEKLSTTAAASVLDGAKTEDLSSDLDFATSLDQVKTIGDNAFQKTAFKKIIFSKTNEVIGKAAFTDAKAAEISFEHCDEDTAHSLEIGDEAFMNVKKLTQSIPVVFANCITKLGNSVFKNSNVAFAYFHAGTKVDSIGKSAFAGTALARFVIPDRITKISDSMFESCISLDTVSISKSLTEIGANAFNGSTIGDLQLRTNVLDAQTEIDGAGVEKDLTNSGITTIGAKAFMGSGITAFTLPKGVTTLATETFSGCKKLSSFTFAAKDTANIPYTFGNSVFSNCGELSSISIPYGIEAMGTAVFNSCSKLATVTVGTNSTDHSTYKSLSASTFAGCSKLTSFTLPTSCTSIDPSAFKGCTTFQNLNNTSQLIKIASGAFEDCKALTGLEGASTLALPSGLNSLDTNAFSGCEKITELSSTGLISSIKSGTFANTGLEKVHLGAKVTSIEEKAFENAPIKEFESDSEKAFDLGRNAFTDVKVAFTSFVCFEDLKETYKDLFKGKCSINIPDSVFHTKKRDAENIKQNTYDFQVGIKDTKKLTKNQDFTLKSETGEDATNSITWSIKDETIATIEAAADGSSVTVTGKAIGQTTLVGTVAETNHQFTYTVYVTPGQKCDVTNPYSTVKIYDVSSLEKDDLKSEENIKKAIKDANIQELKNSKIFYDVNGVKTETKTLYVEGTLTSAAAPTTDSIYWRLDEASTELTSVTVPTETTEIPNKPTYYKGYLLQVAPKAATGKITIEAVTNKGTPNSKATLDIQPVVQSISATKSINMNVNQTQSLKNIASVKTEPANASETLSFTIPKDQQEIATIEEATDKITTKNIGKVTVTVTSNVSKTTTTIDVNVCNPITDVAITKTEATNTPTPVAKRATVDIFQGETLNLSFESSVLDSKLASTDKLQFATASPGVATAGTPTVVNNITSLTVTAVATGSTKLTITGTESNFTTDITIRVKTALNSISIDEKDQKQTVSLGETKDLAKLVKSNPTNHNETLTWESNNTAVATVTEKGVVTALTPGTALITVYCHRTGKSAQITVTADNTITAATITPKVVGTKEKPFYPGASEAVSMSITKKKDAYPASDTGITWSSSNEQIVTVSGGSLTGATITAVKTGSANIIVKNASGKQLASIAVNVSQPTISLETTSVTLYTKIAKRKSYTIKPIINGNDKTVSYKVTKGSKYIKVNSKGKVTYKSKKKAGTGVITVTANGVSTTLSVTINKTIKKKLSVSNSAGELKKKTIKVKKSVGTCSSRYTSSWTALKVTYKSSKKKVASIDSKGLIKLKKKGTTKITTTVDGYKMTYTLKVK